eukprot:SAG22_NODE_1487_length_4318_cov_1.548471_1_plen_96_part_00
MWSVRLEQRRLGFTVVGVEQSAQSVSLERYTPFPRRAVLLLGKEKEGLPQKYLALVDQTVEIPQFGVIRSLNVHVSAAIMMWHALGHRGGESPEN